jgi:hypothetical protein
MQYYLFVPGVLDLGGQVDARLFWEEPRKGGHFADEVNRSRDTETGLASDLRREVFEVVRQEPVGHCAPIIASGLAPQ